MNIFWGIRSALGFTQDELAKAIGVSFATINRWENEKVMPSKRMQEKLLNLCEVKGVNIVSIMLNEISKVSNAITEENPSRIVLFHGSKTGIAGTIQPRSRDVCDFGAGFYMGTDPKQPLTLVCDYEESKLYILSIEMDELEKQEFMPDLNWALFVAYNRGKMDGVKGSNLYNEYKAIGEGKDIIIGSIANDRMFFVMDNFFNGNITDIALVESLSTLNLGRQYVAKTKKACSHIKIEDEVNLPWIARQAFKELSTENRRKGVSLATEICKTHRREGLYFDEILGITPEV